MPAVWITQKIQGHRPFLSAKHVGTYHAVNGEVDVTDISTRPNQNLYLPILQEDHFPWAGRGLLFGSAITALLPNRYGIPEPCTHSVIDPGQLDYLLVPLLGFDRHGNRLGMGGGYYDRALAKCTGARRPFTLGVAFSFQEIAAMEPQPWDIPLDGIVTEKEFIWPVTGVTDAD